MASFKELFTIGYMNEADIGFLPKMKPKDRSLLSDEQFKALKDFFSDSKQLKEPLMVIENTGATGSSKPPLMPEGYLRETGLKQHFKSVGIPYISPKILEATNIKLLDGNGKEVKPGTPDDEVNGALRITADFRYEVTYKFNFDIRMGESIIVKAVEEFTWHSRRVDVATLFYDDNIKEKSLKKQNKWVENHFKTIELMKKRRWNKLLTSKYRYFGKMINYKVKTTKASITQTL